MLKQLFLSSMIVSIGVFLGRITGFVREAILAGHFGVTAKADIAVFMLTLPDALLNILASGAMAAALIPTFKRMSDEQAKVLFFQVSLLVMGIFFGITFFGSLFPNVFTQIFAPGFNAQQTHLAWGYLQVSLWMLPFSVLAGVSMAYLQSQERFFIASLGTVIFNGTIIIALCLFSQSTLSVLSIAIVAGAVLRWGSHLLDIPKQAWSNIFKQPWLVDKALLVRYYQASVAVGLLLLMPAIANAIATYFHAGALAALNYSNKLVQLPLGVCISVLSVVMLPKLSELFSNDLDLQGAKLLCRVALITVFILSLIITCILIVFRQPVVDIVYAHGIMSASGTSLVAELMMIGMLSLPALGLSSILIAIFNARQDTRTPYWISVCAITLFTLFSIFLSNRYGLQGIMYSQVLTCWLVVIFQFAALQRKHDLQVWTALIGRENLLASSLAILCFLPFIAVAPHIHSFLSVAGVMLVAFLVCIMMALLAIKETRIYLINQLKRRQHV